MKRISFEEIKEPENLKIHEVPIGIPFTIPESSMPWRVHILFQNGIPENGDWLRGITFTQTNIEPNSFRPTAKAVIYHGKIILEN